MLSYLLVYICVTQILSENGWLATIWTVFYVGGYIYYYFTIKQRKDTVIFPTHNDEYSKMTLVSFGIIVLIIPVVGYFVADFSIYKALAGVAIGTIMILMGSNEPTKGWLSINKNILTIYGIQGRIDTRQIKEVTLINDKIKITNVYDEHQSSFNLKLNPLSAENIIRFLNEKISNPEFQINNQVIAEE